MDRRVDWLGTLLLVTAGLTFVVSVLSDGRLASTFKVCDIHCWCWHSRSADIITLLIVGVTGILDVLFVLLERILANVHSTPDTDDVP